MRLTGAQEAAWRAPRRRPYERVCDFCDDPGHRVWRVGDLFMCDRHFQAFAGQIDHFSDDTDPDLAHAIACVAVWNSPPNGWPDSNEYWRRDGDWFFLRDARDPIQDRPLVVKMRAAQVGLLDRWAENATEALLSG